MIAVCVLPDHLHCLWRLPKRDANYSVRWKVLKAKFTHPYLAKIGPGGERDASRQIHREAAIWQHRFWEHTLTDQMDLETHLDYIHINPIKHGYVTYAADLPWSSFARYVEEGIYASDWDGETEGRLQMINWE